MYAQNQFGPTEVILFLPGHLVPAGIYKEVGGNREVHLVNEDWLPASLDGQIACYERVVDAVV